MKKLLVLLLLRICLLKAKENKIELGIGNFPIPDLSQQFILPADKTFSSNQELKLIKPLEKYWQLAFDIKVIASSAIVLTLPHTEANSLQLIVFNGKIGMTLTENNEAVSNWVCETKERKWLRVEINYKFDVDDSLTIQVDGNRCENYNSLKVSLKSIKVIKFGDNQNKNVISVRNMILTNGLIEYLIDEDADVRKLEKIHTIKLFETFRIVFDLKITQQSKEKFTIFSIKEKNTNQLLMEISYRRKNIYYCNFLNGPTKSCQKFVFEINNWIYLLIDQWMDNSQYFNTFQVNSDIDNFALKKEGNTFSVHTPKIREVYFENNPNSTVEIKKLIIFNPGSKEFGVVRYNEKPFCSIGWTEENSKAVCNMLNERSKTIPMTINASLFTHVKYFDFSNNIDCKGQERSLQDCQGSVEPAICSENGQQKPPAAVHCGKYMDQPYYVVNGRINIIHSGLPRCYRNDEEAGKVCTKLFTGLFNVPHLPGKVMESSRDQLSSHSVLYKDPECVMKLLEKQCEYDITQNCKYQQIQCSMCFKTELNNIIKEIKFKGPNDDVIASLEVALDKLNTCGRWFLMDCKSNFKLDPNLCSLHSLVLEVLNLLKESIKPATSITLPAEFNVQEYLKYNFLKTNFDDLLSSTHESRESIGNYFNELANFDGEVAKHDIAYALDEWEKANKLIQQKQKGLTDSFLKLSELAIKTQANGLIQTTLKLAVQVAGSFNPIKWLTNTDGSIVDVLETSTNIATIGNKIGIAVGGKTYISEFDEKVKEVKTKMENNKNVYNAISDILKKVSVEKAITEDDSAKFLILYRDFSPAITNEFIVTASTYIDIIMDTFSQQIRDSGDSIIGTVVHGLNEDFINRVTITTKVLMGQYEVVAEKQLEIMEAFARSARAMIAKKSAQNIIDKQNEKFDFDPEFQKLLINIKSIYLLREQKIRLYTDVCNIYTYRNHGEQPQVCKEILNNPDESVLKLLTYNSNSDMCSNAQKIKKIVLVPISLQGDLEQGILSSNTLYNNSVKGTVGLSYLKISNKNWMIKHGWIANEQKSPFFLKKFQLYIPPEANDVSFSYKIKMKLSKVTLNHKNYFFQSAISNYISYHNEDCITSVSNPYKMIGCRDHLKNVCILMHGQETGEYLPVLENSTWLIQLQSQTNLTKLYPVKNMYLKAEVEFCSKSNIIDNFEYKRQVSTKTNACCAKENEYYDLLQEISESRRKSNSQSFCTKCDDGSSPVFFGYFCQKCPNEHLTSDDWFGCKVDETKKKKGKSKGKNKKNI